MFVAYYNKGRLLGLAGIDVLFASMGGVLILQPDGSFDHGKIAALGYLLGGNNDLAGHGLGWLTALFGAAVFPVIAKMMMHREPAVRIDNMGVYWHRWSAKPINWSNVAQIGEASIRGQRFVSLTLHDPSLDPSNGLLAKFASVNNMMGFGHVCLTAQGTDKTHEELVEAVRVHAARHEQSLRAAVTEHNEAAVARRMFGRKGS